MAGRPVSNFETHWSDDHRFLLSHLASQIAEEVRDRFGIHCEVWDLMIEGWRLHLRKCEVHQLHGGPVLKAKWAMWEYAMADFRRAERLRPVPETLGRERAVI